MFLEPSVISETMLPYLLCLAKRYPESSVLAKRLDQWEQENTVSVRENLSICAKLNLGNYISHSITLLIFFKYSYSHVIHSSFKKKNIHYTTKSMSLTLFRRIICLLKQHEHY